MKLPYSYEKQFFTPVLALSLAGHMLLFVGGAFLISSPEYSVQQAPSSVDLVILEEEKMFPEPQEKVMTALPEAQAEASVLVPEEKKVEKKPEPVVMQEEKGALEEAKPNPVVNAPPVYPNYARENGWEGLVMLEVLVSETGAALSVRIAESSGFRILDTSAKRAVEAWQFTPAKLAGKSLRSTVRVPVRFVLEKT